MWIQWICKEKHHVRSEVKVPFLSEGSEKSLLLECDKCGSFADLELKAKVKTSV